MSSSRRKQWGKDLEQWMNMFFCPQGWMLLSLAFNFSEFLSLDTWYFCFIDKDLWGRFLAARFSLGARDTKIQCHKHQLYFTIVHINKLNTARINCFLVVLVLGFFSYLYVRVYVQSVSTVPVMISSWTS